MIDKRRVERLEHELAGCYPRPRWQSPWDEDRVLDEANVLTTDQLEVAEGAFQVMLKCELEKLNGKVPPRKVPDDHPGRRFNWLHSVSGMMDWVLGQRLQQDLGILAARRNEPSGPETRQRLDEEREAILIKLRGVNERCDQRAHIEKARPRGREALGEYLGPGRMTLSSLSQTLRRYSFEEFLRAPQTEKFGFELPPGFLKKIGACFGRGCGLWPRCVADDASGAPAIET